MLDDVLESALTSTPHTTPNKTFPATSTALHAEDDNRFILHPDAFQGMLRKPPSEYLVEVVVEDDQEDAEVDGYDVLARTPTRTLPKVWSLSLYRPTLIPLLSSASPKVLS
jgi:hypothetical protein